MVSRQSSKRGKIFQHCYCIVTELWLRGNYSEIIWPKGFLRAPLEGAPDVTALLLPLLLHLLLLQSLTPESIISPNDCCMGLGPSQGINGLIHQIWDWRFGEGSSQILWVSLLDLIKMLRLSKVQAARDEMQWAEDGSPPLLVKIAPDLSKEDLEDIAAVVLALRLDGLVKVVVYAVVKMHTKKKKSGCDSGSALHKICLWGSCSHSKDKGKTIRVLKRDGFKNIIEAMGIDCR
ncbi:uncharacterized protein LOC116194539 isoform X2 [Punica granatum]|uniref:Uncharacterized protein LOC116194539 isoform X2 n=1 Tax=Punica granatum TaxID=22663 RepID=A0A6P8C6R5_PUNGR|nr:uncharacterized protein LOC116194539 isoform X2 [Punica granatum]